MLLRVRGALCTCLCVLAAPELTAPPLLSDRPHENRAGEGEAKDAGEEVGRKEGNTPVSVAVEGGGEEGETGWRLILADSAFWETRASIMTAAERAAAQLEYEQVCDPPHRIPAPACLPVCVHSLTSPPFPPFSLRYAFLAVLCFSLRFPCLLP